MIALLALLGQEPTGEELLAPAVQTPSVDWAAVAPILALALGGVLLLTITSVSRWLPRSFATAWTVASAAISTAFAVALWSRVGEDGPWSTVAGAVGVDRFSVFLTVVICAGVILAALLADGYLRHEDAVPSPEVYVLMLLSAAGGVVMTMANDLMVLFLGLEVLSIAVYVLAAMHLRRSQSQEAGMKYFVLGAFSSGFLLYGIALVYGATGSVNLVTIRAFLEQNTLLDNGMLLAGFALLLVGLGFKIAAVPFQVWVPDVYQGAPTPVAAYMASVVKTAAFAAILRVFVLAFATQRTDWQPLVYFLAVASMVVGSVVAVAQTNVKRMLAYSSIAHAGFILVGVQAASDEGTAAALFYLAAYTFMVAGSFGVVTLVAGRGDGHHRLEDYRGLGKRAPLVAFAFMVLLFGQAGIPLTSGFLAKFGVIAAAVEARSFWLAAVAMLAAVISAFVYLRIIVSMYMSDDESEAGASLLGRIAPTTWAVLGLAVVVTIGLGIVPGPVIDWAGEAIPELVADAPLP
jgi:NADH-quinone oxidoreductase subunit N